MATNTAHRVTPTDGPTFGEVMRDSARQVIRGASAAVSLLPSGPIVAASVRPGSIGYSVSPASASTRMPNGSTGGLTISGTGASLQAEGADGSSGSNVTGDAAVEDALARSQDMNMYLIELQERVASQNRVFTTYSNVLKAKHDTVKNAISNIR